MHIKIENTVVTGIKRISVSSGFPASDNPFGSLSRLTTKGSAVMGSGHDCALKGITVHTKLTADHSFWLQWQRYHFHDIISSTSKMHSITKMELNFHPKTSAISQSLAQESILDFKNGKIDFEEVIMSMPIGLMLKADTITNYLQLKTIWNQRRNHKMASWREYCEWIEHLPLMEQIFERIKKNTA